MFDQYFVMALEKLARNIGPAPAMNPLLMAGGAAKALASKAPPVPAAAAKGWLSNRPKVNPHNLFDTGGRTPMQAAMHTTGLPAPKPMVASKVQGTMHGPVGSLGPNNSVVGPNGLQKLSNAQYNYVLREAFKEELQKLAYSPEAIEALSKIALQLGSMKETIGYVPGMMEVGSRGLAPAVAARRAAAAAATKKAPGAASGVMSRLRGLFSGGGKPMIPATA